MTRFRFRLETVLKLRCAERDQRRQQLAEALEAQQILQQREKELSDETQQVRSRLRQQSEPGEVQVDGLLSAHRYELVLRAHLHQLTQHKAQVAAEIERRRQALVEADRAVRTLEKLEEKQRLAHRRQEEHAERKQLDETAQQRAALRSNGAR